MKRLIITALLVVGLTSFAQDKKEMENRPDRPQMEKMSPAQRNELMLKKMTLELDLNAKQQEQFKGIIAEKSTKMETMKGDPMEKKGEWKRPTADERFAMENKRLDEQIAMQNKVKSILAPDQFEKWKQLKEKNQDERREKFQGKRPGKNHKKNDDNRRD